MKQNIIHIGLDVDDTRYHGSALQKQGQKQAKTGTDHVLLSLTPTLLPGKQEKRGLSLFLLFL